MIIFLCVNRYDAASMKMSKFGSSRSIYYFKKGLHLITKCCKIPMIMNTLD